MGDAMKRRFLGFLVLTVALMAPVQAVTEAPPAAGKTLKAFQSDEALQRYLQSIGLARKQAERARQARYKVQSKAVSAPAPPPPSAPAADKAGNLETVMVTGQRAGLQSGMSIKASAIGGLPDRNAADALQRVPGASITNNQVANVDEGDIVKSCGDYLIVLHHGRLFSISIKGGSMRPVDAMDASAPGIDPRGDWYDEMLVSEDRIIVIGYSYSRGGTQVNRFRIGQDGHLTYQDAYALRSNDYYSARNYASRLIGNTLIFYSPNYIPWWARVDIPVILPGLRRWTGDVKQPFQTIGSARSVYVAPGLLPEDISALHTVTSCDLTAPTLVCKAVSIVGPGGRVFYVSETAVYVWASSYRWWDKNRSEISVLYRMPLDGSPPQALNVSGAPVDQFSFNETAQGLDVLVRSESGGDAMWAGEHSRGQIALAHIPFVEIGDGTARLERRFYRPLPKPAGEFYNFHNRFVGDHLLYGTGNGWGTPKDAAGTLYVVPVTGGEVVKLSMPNGIDRIEAMGGDAVVVGSTGKNVVFNAITLKPGTPPAIGDQHTLGGASQAETRSHGFFFKPERDYSGSYGVLGLPVMRDADPAYEQLFREAASVVFVRRNAGKFTLLGDLPSHPQDARDDGCEASCVDWYGNSRPIFFGTRTFALMGYELVEGVLGERDVAEKGRVNFNPGILKPVRD